MLTFSNNVIALPRRPLKRAIRHNSKPSAGDGARRFDDDKHFAAKGTLQVGEGMSFIMGHRARIRADALPPQILLALKHPVYAENLDRKPQTGQKPQISVGKGHCKSAKL